MYFPFEVRRLYRAVAECRLINPWHLLTTILIINTLTLRRGKPITVVLVDGPIRKQNKCHCALQHKLIKNEMLHILSHRSEKCCLTNWNQNRIVILYFTSSEWRGDIKCQHDTLRNYMKKNTWQIQTWTQILVEKAGRLSNNLFRGKDMMMPPWSLNQKTSFWLNLDWPLAQFDPT